MNPYVFTRKPKCIIMVKVLAIVMTIVMTIVITKVR